MNQVPNSAGGFSFAVDDWSRLDRFLILGTESASYYASAPKLGRDNAEAVIRCIQADGARTVVRIVEISESGRAPKNEPAIFALALAAALGNPAARKLALDALPKVCRFGTALFSFIEYHQGLRGWSRSLLSAVSGWYHHREPRQLAYQVAKYQERNGWSHRDLLRLAHTKGASDSQKIIFNWVVKGWEGVGDEPHDNPDLRLIWAFERAKRATTAREVAALITDHDMPRECVPTQFLADKVVWAALLAHQLPMTALLRNLGNLSKCGLLIAGSDAEKTICARLTDTDYLRKSRIHPVALLLAQRVYGSGKGIRGKGEWPISTRVVDALDAAFYLAFANVEPTNKRLLLALDVSGSMASGDVGGVPGLSPRDASAILALVTMATEPNCEIVAFSDGRGSVSGGWFSSAKSNLLTPLAISPKQRLSDAIREVSGLPMNGTDCALPMLWAKQQKKDFDGFVVYTDSETWAGSIHPTQALKDYRQARSIAAKSAVVGLVANEFSIADPNDGGQMDCVGFDASLPVVLSDFLR